ncbi:MAG: ectoine hydroxylase [Steroidobacteraceae bacterium]
MTGAAVHTAPASSEDIYRSRCESQPALVPRVDPVMYSLAGPLSAAQCAAFDRRGYVELEFWFEQAELTSMMDEAKRLMRSDSLLNSETLILEPDSSAVRSVFHIHEQSKLFRRLVMDSRLVGVAQQLLNDDVYIHQSRLNYKAGFSGKEFYWHSDFETWHIEDGMPRMRALSMSIALTENTEYNGPLLVMPGSHNTYVRCVGTTPDDHYKQSLRRQEYGVPDQESLRFLHQRGGIAASMGAAGTITIFDCNIMHGSSSNISPLPRSNVFIVYNGTSNKLTTPFGGTAPRPEFVAVRDNTTALVPVAGNII